MNKDVESFVKTVKEYIDLMDKAEEMPLKSFLAKCSFFFHKFITKLNYSLTLNLMIAKKVMILTIFMMISRQYGKNAKAF